MAEPGRDWTRWVVVALLLVGGVGWLVHWRSDRQRILRRLGGLEEILQKEEVETDLVVLANGRKLVEFFAESFSLQAQPYQGRLTTSNDLVLAYRRLHGLGETIDVILAEQELEIADRGTAWLAFRATVTVDFGDRRGREAYLVSSNWTREEGRWKIRDLEVLEVLASEDGLGLLSGRLF